MDVATALVSSVPANDRIVTSRVACVDSRESSPVPREASFHEEAIIDRTRAFEPIFIDGENPSVLRRFLARRLTKRGINRRLSNAITWLHDSSIERPSSFDFPSILPTSRSAFLRNDDCKMRCTIGAIMQTNYTSYVIWWIEKVRR